MIHRSLRSILTVILAVVTLAGASTPALASERQNGDVRVMTYNIYQGTELDNSIAARTPFEFVVGAAADFRMVQQTNFAERAQSLARIIDKTRPDLIGLQEVALWRTRFPYNPSLPPEAVYADFLKILLDALAARGLEYVAVASVNNFDVSGPALLSADGLTGVRLTDRNVILARARDHSARMHISNPQAANFTTNLTITTVGGPVTVLEGWAAVDVTAKGRTFRFITTHLDASAPPIRLAQATELLNGPAGTALPVVIVGDTNTTNNTPTYSAFISAGFSDVWERLHSTNAGFTCCQVLPAIVNPASALLERVDRVFVRGALAPEAIALVGADPADRTPSGLWPSDHAGLVAALDLERAGER